MDRRYLPQSQNIEDRRPEEGRIDPKDYMPGIDNPTPEQYLRWMQEPSVGRGSMALGYGDIGTKPRPPSLLDMMGNGRDLLPTAQPQSMYRRR